MLVISTCVFLRLSWRPNNRVASDKTGCKALHSLLSMAKACSFVPEDYHFSGHDVCLEASVVKKAAIQAITDIHPLRFIQSFRRLLKHHSKEDSEACRSQNTTLIHATENREGFQKTTIESYLLASVLMQLDKYRHRKIKKGLYISFSYQYFNYKQIFNVSNPSS